jgi:AraC family transcriptional regulator
LAGLCNISRFHFARQFKIWTGQSPIHYVMNRRIARARFLLLYTQDTIAVIAESLGFTDQSHFSRVFRRYEGKSPSRFRCELYRI